MELGASAYLTDDLKIALKAAYREGKSLGSSEKEAAELLDTVIGAALSFGSSDLHLQRTDETKLQVKFRVDGILRTVVELPQNISEGLISRLKYITHMRLDSPLPQDGRFATKYQDKEVVARVSIVPTRLGEDVVMRLLADIGRPKDLNALGLSERDFQVVKVALDRPYGMVLACGPTSSGKTATVYNMLGYIKNDSINICTIEDPVEYTINDVRQLQIETSIDYTFAVGLRAILRHDPDVVFVGEIRDKETAEIAVDAALTGHLVLSTLHANTAPEAVTRLRDLGVRPYLLGSTLNTIVAQRLVRKLCPKCRQKFQPNPEDIQLVKKEHGMDISKLSIYEGKGCDECREIGYQGRTGIFEVLKVSEDIKPLILSSVPVNKVFEQARKEGFTTMFEDGLKKVEEGIISLSDLLAATG